MDNCKNTRFSSYNQYNHLLGVSTYRRELESTQIMRLSQQVEDRIEDIQELVKGKENEIMYDLHQPISTECHVSFLNPISEGSVKNPQIFELPVGGMQRQINNGFHKIIQTIPNKGIIGIKCFSEDGLGGFLVPHENARHNVYVMATPHSNEHIELVWSELNGLWFVLNFSGHFEDTDPSNISGSMLNIQENEISTSLVGQTGDDTNRIPSTIGWTNSTETYTISDTQNKPNPATNTEADAKTEPATNTEADAKTEPATDTNTEADAKTEPATDTEADAKT
jgi:hypothetical protein